MSDRFLGNHTHTDYFKLLRQDGDSLVIGARNVIYNITIDGLVENREQVRRREIQTLRTNAVKRGTNNLARKMHTCLLRVTMRALRPTLIASTLRTEIWQHGWLVGVRATEFRELVPKSGADLS